MLRRLRASSKATRATRTISVRRVDLRVDAAARAVGQRLDAARLAEIDAAGELAHDHDVEAARSPPASRSRRRSAASKHQRRAQIGEEVHLLAQAQQAALRLHARRAGCPISARRPRRTARHRRRAPRASVASVQRRAVRVDRRRRRPDPRSISKLAMRLRVEPFDDAVDLRASPRGRCRRRAGRGPSCSIAPPCGLLPCALRPEPGLARPVASPRRRRSPSPSAG